MADVTVTDVMKRAGMRALLGDVAYEDSPEDERHRIERTAFRDAELVLEAALAHAPLSEREAELAEQAADHEAHFESECLAHESSKQYIKQLLAERDQLAADIERLREALEPFALAFEGAGDDFDPCTITIALGEPRRALKALNSTPPQALAARDGEVLGLREALKWQMHRWEDLAQCESDPNEPIADNGMVVWDGWRAGARDFAARCEHALTNSQQPVKDAEDRILEKAAVRAESFAASCFHDDQDEDGAVAAAVAQAIRAMKGGE